MKLEIMTIQFNVTYVTSGITLDVLMIALKNAENWKKIDYSGTVQIVQWKHLS